MRLTTASFWTVPEGYAMVSIANSSPKGITPARTIESLKPGWDLVYAYKKSDASQGEKELEYINGYMPMVTKNIEHILTELGWCFVHYDDVALCCWEKKGDFCHRILAFDFLQTNREANYYLTHHFNVEFISER